MFMLVLNNENPQKWGIFLICDSLAVSGKKAVLHRVGLVPLILLQELKIFLAINVVPPFGLQTLILSLFPCSVR